MNSIPWLAIAVALSAALVLRFGWSALFWFGLTCAVAALISAALWLQIRGEATSWRWCGLCQNWHNGSHRQSEVPEGHDGTVWRKHYETCRKCSRAYDEMVGAR